MKYQLLTLFSFILLIACNQGSGVNKFEDPELVKIYEYKDKRNTANLLTYLFNENKNYKIEAIKAFGTLQDPIALEKLHKEINDPDPDIRKVVAFAIGQTKNAVSQSLLINRLEHERDTEVHFELMLALGRCITGNQLDYLVQFDPWDLSQQESKAWALYRAGLRGVKSNASTAYMMNMLESNNSQVRFACSNYLGRIAGNELGDFVHRLVEAFMKENDPEVKLNLARALGKNDNEEASNSLLEALQIEKDYRVIVNILRAINKVNSDQVGLIEKYLSSNHAQISVEAANLVARSESITTDGIKSLINGLNDPRALGILYGRMLQLGNFEESSSIISAINESEDPYTQAELLKSLVHSENNLDFITENTFQSSNAYVRNAGMSAILSMMASSQDKSAYAPILKQAIESEDIGLISNASSAIANTQYNFVEIYEDYEFLLAARGKLKLPVDAEALINLQAAIDVFEGNEPSPTFENPYNNPINWDSVRMIPRDQQIRIQTTKGDIDIELFVEESPGTVEFIVRLIKSGFYDGLSFHRVVPNFVAQGGCPRGDGYGGTPESIRSEFGMNKYKTGSVGMASAGKDTESCQFFITHRPTPHLDGAYTIFGEVVSGLKVLENVGVGTTIESIVLK